MSKAKSKPSTGKRQPPPKKTSVNPWWIGAAILTVAVMVGAGLLLQTTGAPQAASLPTEISVADAAARRAAGAVVLDVREPSEWNELHVPGATLIPLGELAARVNEVPKDREVVVICRSGNRSQEGRDILKRAGFTQVTSVAGGIRQWQAAGYETVTGP
jgi:rhodanese-related sulfurtransferase